MNLSPEAGSRRFLTAVVNQLASDIDRDLMSLAAMIQDDAVSTVHLVRKRFKMYRAFLKLFKKCGQKEKLIVANSTLRDLGKSFSELRDAHVRSETLRDLLSDSHIKRQKEAIQTLLHCNDKKIKELESALLNEQNLFAWLPKKIRSDTAVHCYLKSLRPTAECIRLGINDTFAKCHVLNAMRQKNTDPERLHEWRKRIKDLQYQYELSVHYMPPLIQPSAEQINSLTDLLGHDQDLHNLKTWISGQNGLCITENDSQTVCAHLRNRRKRLEKELDSLGNTIFSVSPIEFENQLNTAGS